MAGNFGSVCRAVWYDPGPHSPRYDADNRVRIATVLTPEFLAFRARSEKPGRRWSLAARRWLEVRGASRGGEVARVVLTATMGARASRSCASGGWGVQWRGSVVNTNEVSSTSGF